jgi:hypothetical protein
VACPNCREDWYTSYSNGTWREGYCQNCGLETKVPTKDKDVVPVIHIEKPRAKNKLDRIMRRSK